VRRRIFALCLLVAAAVVIASCGDGDNTSGGAYGGKGGNGYGSGGSASAGVISAAEVGELGTILVDSTGRTLYDFHKDQGTTSSCFEACAEAWPPLLTEGEPEAEGGAVAAKLGTTERQDGTTQVTYAGHPLYTYVGDKGPGEANGNDIDQFGAEWYALQPSGEEPED
jgi:predicted lipoprotein with Yx(FWY)xxD motif